MQVDLTPMIPLCVAFRPILANLLLHPAQSPSALPNRLMRANLHGLLLLPEAPPAASARLPNF